MKKIVIPCAIAAAIAFTAVAWRQPRDNEPAVAATALAEASPAPDDPAQAALRASPQADAYRQRAGFERDARDFFANAASLRAVERSERAEALSRQIDGYERSGGLSAGEAVLLRTALVKATVDDPAQQAEQVAAIAERYRLHADRRAAAHAQQQRDDPRFQRYKMREAQVVAEVMTMQTIPGGLTRDQYLRQRLQAERERAYAP